MMQIAIVIVRWVQSLVLDDLSLSAAVTRACVGASRVAPRSLSVQASLALAPLRPLLQSSLWQRVVHSTPPSNAISGTALSAHAHSRSFP